jgi:uncharacterized membrane protein YccC
VHDWKATRGNLKTAVDAEELIRQTVEKVRAALDGAQERADQIVREAEEEARRIRTRAEAEARERLDQVREALGRLEAGLGGAPPPQASGPEPPAKAPEPRAEPEPERPKPPPETEAPEPEPEPGASAKASNDDAGAARLVAMKLALDGTSRDQARERLATEYDLPDLDALLEDVYSKAGR